MKHSRTHAFTLIEVLLAVFIVTLVITAVYFTLYATLDAFHAGKGLMDQYQEARIGTQRILTDLRQAASPNQYWQNVHRNQELVDEDGNPIPLSGDIDPDRGVIKFMGERDRVTFVRPEVVPERDEQPYDLVEVTLALDGEEKAITRTRTKSVLAGQMMRWREEYLNELLGTSETSYAYTLPDANYEEKREVLMRNAVGLRFAYYDGEQWEEDWDSTEPLFETGYDYNPETGNPTPTPDPQTKGLPYAVEVQVEFEADTTGRRKKSEETSLLKRTFLTRTLLPHSNLNLAESPFQGNSRGNRDPKRRGLRKIQRPKLDTD